MSIISYHSLEDRLVKNLIKTGNTEGKLETDIFGQTDLSFKAVNRKIILPNDAEMRKTQEQSQQN